MDNMEEKISEYESKMAKTIGVLESDYDTIRAGRANPHVLDQITIDYWGVPSSIQQVANVSVPEPRMLLLQPYDRNMIKDIERAILASDIGITPGNDGNVIRLVFPEMTEERRKELAKDVKKKGENAKVAIRNIRRDANDTVKKMQKNSEISEDDQKKYEDKIQKLTDRFIGKIDEVIETKTKEIMTV